MHGNNSTKVGRGKINVTTVRFYTVHEVVYYNWVKNVYYKL